MYVLSDNFIPSPVVRGEGEDEDFVLVALEYLPPGAENPHLVAE